MTVVAPDGYVVERNIMANAAEIFGDTPILVVSGGRQTGKSTLMRHLLRDQDARYINLDNSTDREAALADPDAFVRQYERGVLAIDEIQRVPGLLLSLKAAVDEDPRPGRFVVTGSSNVLAMAGAQESLAGRAETIKVRPLSQGERLGVREDFAAWAWALGGAAELPSSQWTQWTRSDYLKIIARSDYPGIRDATRRRQARWLGNYVELIVSKDATEAYGIRYPDRLMEMLRYFAAEPATEFVAAPMARGIDVPSRSLPSYAAALANVYLLDEIPAWSANLSNRVIRRPKIMFADVGLAAYLSGVDAEGLERDLGGTLTGGLVENFVAAELAKQQQWSSRDFRMYHYRDRNGPQVDLILEDRARSVVAIEVKASTTIRRQQFAGLEFLREKLGEQFVAGIVLHTGQQALSFGDRLWALPLSALWQAT